MEEQNETKASNVHEALAISARQLSQMLGISLRQCWRLSSAGKLPKPVRLGGSIRWNRAEVQHWFEAGCPDRRLWESMKGTTHGR